MNITFTSFRTLALLLAFSLAAFVPVSSAGTTKRVKFARGRTSAVLKGSLGLEETITYVLGARAGQTLILHVSIPDRQPNQHVVFSIVDPAGEDLLESYDTDWSGELKRTGDYKVLLSTFESPAAPYVLEVTIR
ncbi:MAG: hypothetical protein IPF53_07725 [Blastocatellia bacterium]|jgi:hypothetical protein|nr:hypothetical protein [Blastocatellia bacterium]